MRVLLVDDEVSLGEALKRGLSAEGFAVDLAKDGLEGLRMAKETAYDIIVLDIMLPGMNGFKLTDTLRKEEIWTPILMLTAKDGELDEAEALDTGADDFLKKPFSFTVLLARMRALLRRGVESRPPVLSAGELSLDPASHIVKRGDVEIDLTSREFSFLELLLRSKGRVLTKREIIEHVWDYDFEGDSNIVEVYIGYLRRKIDLPFGTKSIKTVRGVGYLLDESGGANSEDPVVSKVS
ncbi:DNA-binding response regulator, OmpR family, contains REC and winged-helix (wHTH) domain [Ferrithrix thermotolerans DSM 19514]|uniref:DNA-binding response regulator, OmpR family, contains REC and winged-helix (WHTH) domain n=1 Tax=Ferrithrix thermotolerans DSM 19514 TaxID=1121881 RepID=A0A1M4VUV5_9ACTN|nr:response regulator transcription factor [Ferrithrix thermotolerans]SHE72821.1 DNA-binding response regulator, OmpR family, contains REC and winged-helix (wHTH) domain [Ferrithrix thermotolerans DSM 19514]